MRKFSEQESRKLLSVTCNCCGRKIVAKNGIVEEECVRLEVPFGFFSRKDGQVHHFDLCETCYDKVVSEFQIPVEIEEKTEFL